MKPNINSLPHSKRFPSWLRQSVGINREAQDTKELLRSLHINTVCTSARCPNIHDCFSKKRCTFLILGRFCTRNCAFCAVEKGVSKSPDKEEIFSIKKAVKKLNLHNVIMTSVTRDDLEDGGAGHFADCTKTLKEWKPSLNIEALVPDFLGRKESVEKVVFSKVDVFSHNVETIPRLYNKIRPGADYKRSLTILRYAKELNPSIITKSGLMVGLGEEKREVYNVMEDLKEAGCDIVTIGQYLKPAKECLEVEEFLHPDEFTKFSEKAKELGFKKHSCEPFTRSSYISNEFIE